MWGLGGDGHMRASDSADRVLLTSPCARARDCYLSIGQTVLTARQERGGGGGRVKGGGGGKSPGGGCDGPGVLDDVRGFGALKAGSSGIYYVVTASV